MIFYSNEPCYIKDENTFTDTSKISCKIISINPVECRLELYNKKRLFYIHNLCSERLEEGISYKMMIPYSYLESQIVKKNENIIFADNTYLQKFEILSEYIQTLPFIQIYSVPKSKSFIVRTNMPTLYVDCKPEINSLSFNEIISIHDPIYKSKYMKKKMRKPVLTELDANDSLSYIEAQLDFLTSLIFSIVDSQDSIKKKVVDDFKEYQRFKNCVEKNYVFNRKSKNSCLEEIENIKTKTRNIQESYYEKSKK